MDPQQKAIANVFLDVVSAVDVTGETELPDGWSASFADRFAELRAVPIVDDGDVVSVDLTAMTTSVALLVNVLVEVIAADRDADRLAVVSTIRQHIERNL